jgi:acetyltransferase
MTLQSLIEPTSIAVIGASSNPEKIGHQILDNIVKGGFEGRVYPINPKEREILGLRCYPNVMEVPDKVDVAIIVVPAEVVPSVLGDCGKKRVENIVVISSGFSEVGKADLEGEMVKICRKNSMRLLGPNVIGYINTAIKLNASFGTDFPFPGKIAFISQSGALGIAITGWTWMERVGISVLVSLGNMADISFHDLIDYFSSHADTICIAAYMEGLDDGRKLIEAASRTSMNVPIVAFKAGRSERGSAATVSHTGSLAGEAGVYDGAFKQSGIIRSDSLHELFDRSLALSLLPPMAGDNCLIITNAGGAGVMASDTAEELGIEISDPPERLIRRFREIVPPFGSVKNPVDMTAMAMGDEYRDAIKAALLEPSVNAVLVIYTVARVVDPMSVAKAVHEAVSSAGIKKPIVVNLIGGVECETASKWLKGHGIPAYPTPERSMNVIAALREYGDYISKEAEPFKPYKVDRDRVKDILKGVSGKGILREDEAIEVFKAYGIPTPKTAFLKSQEELGKLKDFDYPIVMKISSPDIQHKTDVGGVRLGIRDGKEAVEAFNEMMERVKEATSARVEGVIVQEMVPEGVKVIMGGLKDPTFGPTVMFGLGGIMVEVLKEVVFRVAPVNRGECLRMVGEVRGSEILKGFRGAKGVHKNCLADGLSRLSQLIYDFPEIVEVDANPVIAHEDGIWAVDALIRIDRD